MQVGDYVFARTGTQAGNEYYVPAIVIATPERVETGDKLYTVLMFNNREVSKPRKLYQSGNFTIILFLKRQIEFSRLMSSLSQSRTPANWSKSDFRVQ